MDVSYKQEVTVGAIVLVAIVAFVLGLGWLSGRSLAADRDDFWKVQFRDVRNLKVSSVVRISGVPVGRVEDIDLVDVGKVLVYVSLPERIVPRNDASAEVVPIGFVGDVAVDFHPGEAGQPLRRDRVILGSQAPGLSDIAAGLRDRTDTLLINAQKIVNERTAEELYASLDELQATLVSARGTLGAAERTMRLLGDADRGPTAELNQTMRSFRQLGARLDSTLANPGLQAALTRTDTLTTRLGAMTQQLTAVSGRLDTLLAGVSAGRGTVGKLATDAGLYTDIRELSQSMRRLVDELQKNPGKVGVTVKLF